MASKNLVERTVQYWRLVDARDGTRVEDQDWDQILRSLYGKRNTSMIDGREHAGTVYALQVIKDWDAALDTSKVTKALPRADPATTYGLVIAAGKDYVPNQENITSGAQKPMGLAGKDWEPVDNLFVWMLPFGNMFGVLAESTSSSRAGKFAEWLTKATRHLFKGDPEFAWDAQPVIDPTRAALLQNASGLRSAIYAGELGANVDDASGARKLFLGPKKTPDAIRIEIKATLVRGKSSHQDEASILEWFNANFGALDGKVDKAQVVISGGQDTPPTEVDLIQHRLTRKSLVRIATGTTRAFTASSAVGAIIDAFVIDRSDLLRLRRSDD